MKLLILISIWSAFLTANAKNFSSCHLFLNNTATDENSRANVTDNFIAYLGKLFEEGVLTLKDFETIQLTLINENKLLNPIEGQVGSKHLYHSELINNYIQNGSLNLSTVQNWLQGFLIAQGKAQVQKAKTVQQTKIAEITVLHRVEPNPRNATFKAITNPLLVMSTTVTQKMWMEVMGKLPPNIKLCPDNPVTQITWPSAIIFANELSKRYGLTPAYNITKTEFIGDPATGTYRMVDGELITINAPKEDIYQTEGFRLPTKLEMQFLLSDRGRVINKSKDLQHFKFFGNIGERELNKYAWNSGNKQDLPGTPLPVAELLPFTIDGHDFFDLYGNVNQWLYDDYHDTSDVLVQGGHKCTGGGNATSISFELVDPFKSFRANEFSFHIGFRLVRSLQK